MSNLQTLFTQYRIFTGNLKQLPRKEKLVINTINQYSHCLAEEDSEFKKALQKSDVLLPDGVGIVLSTKILTGQSIQKVAGADLHEHFLKSLNESGGKCFYLGSSEPTLQKIKERLNKEYPNIQMESYSPPFKDKFNDLENAIMINKVNLYRPDVLFVGMTAPKQEKWVANFKEHLDAKVICSIGAVFDFYAGTIQRPHPIWVNLGLEWFVRLVKEPKRLWRRYLVFGPVFISRIASEKIKSSNPAQELQKKEVFQ
ncbi:WecB/TagA/CpsF family glycosyltransferase [Pararhodonellum marinum]|uniref:WecB/TagA/CpsF family glycosyltransferase n=1 Tax=Pararhodonellum marinum TaxID=2755358 RepID=UPI00188E0837|nr:WecB/TagA/CpsF family glycosyltransferase [Pararhodonellum marinum]